jgi:dTDP-4-dehydrorhamnose reductase
VLEQPGAATLILRTAWLYSPGGANFVLTMLRLMRSHGRVRVVADQIGTPTSADSVASALWALAARPDLHGIQHWTDAGTASWYDFACAIAEEALGVGLLSAAVTVEPITTPEYPTAAPRPTYSVLDSTALRTALALPAVYWRTRLRTMLEALARG